MNKGFWDKLPKPFFALAPMADVTDPAFRRVIAKYGKPDILWTEFVSADGLALAPEEGRKKLLKDLEYSESERPIVAQFFSSNAEHMKKAASLAHDLGFDGVDINMGCPDRSIEKQGAGAAHMKDHTLAQEVIYAAKEGAKGLPISIKTRLGYSTDDLEEWLPKILETKVAAVTIHARTRKEMSKVPARWVRIKDAVAIRDELAPETFILGNGDAVSMDDARKKITETGADGVMLGRAIFGNPWLFSNKDSIGVEDKLKVMVEHTKLFEELLGGTKNFAVMKKHYKAYVNGFDGASELRQKLMETKNATEVEEIIKNF